MANSLNSSSSSSSSRKNCKNDCIQIHNKWGRTSCLVQNLAYRTNLERQQIRETYKVMYGEDVMDRLRSTEVSNQRNEIYYSLLFLLMLNQHERDAWIARESFKNGETNYKALIEIYSGRKSSHLLVIQQAYQTKYRRQLDQDIINSEPPHPYQRILIALATSHKSHQMDVSRHVAKCDARRLYETGEGRGGSIEEAVVLEIFSKRSIQQLRLTFSTYKHIYGHSYAKSLKKETSGEFEDDLRVVVKCLYTPPKYYAEILHSCIKGTSMDKTALARVLVSRAEIDMDEIQRVFKKKYDKELKDAICESNIPGGDYRDFLVALASIRSP